MAVMLMFAIALIAGQARANSPAEVSASSDFGSATRTSILLDRESLQRIRSLPYLVDAMLAIDVELSIGELTLRPGNANAAGSDDSSGQ